ncbi:MAG: dihydropteroate synthase [bacterium]|nr:dihydropteroate synthase [bacterium]
MSCNSQSQSNDIVHRTYPPIQCPRCILDVSANRTFVMGILNITPDSFSDGGKYYTPDQAYLHAMRMIEEGADIIDVGGESSRPGAQPVSAEEEIARIVPVIERLATATNIPISVDTYKAQVAESAINAGAQMINDITAMTYDPAMLPLAARTGVPVVLMHMQGTPQTMQLNPQYTNVVSDIIEYLNNAIQIAKQAGINEEQIIIDPGIGFGKTLEHNLSILHHLSEFLRLGRPILIGVSRKSFIGKILDLPVDERLEGTAAAVAIAVIHGAKIVRVHDVKAMVRVVKIADAIRVSS